ncbi:hypothetical protein UF75_4375 [Desulfosporosinus sp. I2]|uniref:hypothetical protein n=1 Tax=Desulfosporosinus sp. I2 TaxID=1617025 RepID=UPI0005EDF5E1|nr:hypothetical protein [Desulfosporosinus sp. I2]KJR45231.1 hypothetical protein UF75_4375 [Desulfosporosinus sp. I2]
MLKAYKVVLAGLSLLLLGGCANLSWTTAGKIIPPVHNICPLEGQWKVNQTMQSNGNSGGDNQSWEGKTIQFTREVAMLGDYVWSNPAFKIKKVNSTNYLMTKYLNLSSTLMPNSKEVEVITVSSAESFLGEFMKIDETKLIAFVQNKALYLQKVSDQVDSSLTSANLNDFKTNRQNNLGASGVLVGLKIPKESGANGDEDHTDFTYQTLWLALDNKKLHPILTGNNIFFPRSSGFWELQVRQVQEGATMEDVLSAHDVSTKAQEQRLRTMEISRGEDKKGASKKVIDYIGNDYVAVENDINGNHLQVLPVDKISTPEGIKLSDLLLNSGFATFSNARAQARRSLNTINNITSFDDDGFEQNFGLIRKNGHWYLRGRINYYDQDSNDPNYMDFNVNLVPPAKLIFYDTLWLSWQYIKDRVPDAVDAFTSPNQDMALVLTKTKLQVYAISAGQLGNEPLAKIDLQSGASVIMAEWATGSYVDNWEKAFRVDGAAVMTMENAR